MADVTSVELCRILRIFPELYFMPEMLATSNRNLSERESYLMYYLSIIHINGGHLNLHFNSPLIYYNAIYLIYLEYVFSF